MNLLNTWAFQSILETITANADAHSFTDINLHRPHPKADIIIHAERPVTHVSLQSLAHMIEAKRDIYKLSGINVECTYLSAEEAEALRDADAPTVRLPGPEQRNHPLTVIDRELKQLGEEPPC